MSSRGDLYTRPPARSTTSSSRPSAQRGGGQPVLRVADIRGEGEEGQEQRRRGGRRAGQHRRRHRPRRRQGQGRHRGRPHRGRPEGRARRGGQQPARAHPRGEDRDHPGGHPRRRPARPRTTVDADAVPHPVTVSGKVLFRIPGHSVPADRRRILDLAARDQVAPGAEHAKMSVDRPPGSRRTPSSGSRRKSPSGRRTTPGRKRSSGRPCCGSLAG
jgi:hypothetical protein